MTESSRAVAAAAHHATTTTYTANAHGNSTLGAGIVQRAYELATEAIDVVLYEIFGLVKDNTTTLATTTTTSSLQEITIDHAFGPGVPNPPASLLSEDEPLRALRGNYNFSSRAIHCSSCATSSLQLSHRLLQLRLLCCGISRSD